MRLGADKEVEREDAARVVGAEVRSDPGAAGRGGRVRRRRRAAEPWTAVGLAAWKNATHNIDDLIDRR